MSREAVEIPDMRQDLLAIASPAKNSIMLKALSGRVTLIWNHVITTVQIKACIY